MLCNFTKPLFPVLDQALYHLILGSFGLGSGHQMPFVWSENGSDHNPAVLFPIFMHFFELQREEE